MIANPPSLREFSGRHTCYILYNMNLIFPWICGGGDMSALLSFLKFQLSVKINKVRPPISRSALSWIRRTANMDSVIERERNFLG